MALKVEIFKCRSDNYGYLLHDPATGATAALDAPEEQPIRDALKRTGWKLTDIFITHHHPDHTDGIAGLKAEYGAKITGPRAENDKISGLDVLVAGGDKVSLGEINFDIFDTPGHTLGHIVFHDAAGGHLFSADALFSLGCGRMFEGTPGPMWEGLKALRGLSDGTLIYCGHEYSAANADFALSIDPDNAALQARAAEITNQRAAGEFTIPVTIGAEKTINPFLRADEPEMATLMNMSGAEPGDVMVRTFSKMGLAALRIGWLYGPDHVVDALNRLRGPFNVNLAAQAAGVAAVKDTEFTASLKTHNAQWRDWLSKELSSNRFKVLPSQGNFILVLFPDEPGLRAEDADAALLAKGLVTRHVAAYDLPNALRITIGSAEAMKAVAQVLNGLAKGGEDV